MKKFLIIIAIIIILLLISGYVEVSYCHSWMTARNPAELGGIPDSQYWSNTPFCKVNAYPSLPGAFLISVVQ